jgi:hypothetical protein
MECPTVIATLLVSKEGLKKLQFSSFYCNHAGNDHSVPQGPPPSLPLPTP